MFTSSHSIDYERLFKLRLIVGRYGEMDGARWWNTNGLLGRQGAVVLKRGFPTTHFFAQARIVFAVARSRCRELFDPPGCMTLWNITAEVEDQFEERWQDWLDKCNEWSPVFERVASTKENDLLTLLNRFELMSDAQVKSTAKLRRAAENRAVPVPGTHYPADEVITLLAAGFSRGEPGSPAIPYAKLEA